MSRPTTIYYAPKPPPRQKIHNYHRNNNENAEDLEIAVDARMPKPLRRAKSTMPQKRAPTPWLNTASSVEEDDEEEDPDDEDECDEMTPLLRSKRQNRRMERGGWTLMKKRARNASRIIDFASINRHHRCYCCKCHHRAGIIESSDHRTPSAATATYSPSSESSVSLNMEMDSSATPVPTTETQSSSPTLRTLPTALTRTSSPSSTATTSTFQDEETAQYRQSSNKERNRRLSSKKQVKFIAQIKELLLMISTISLSIDLLTARDVF